MYFLEQLGLVFRPARTSLQLQFQWLKSIWVLRETKKLTYNWCYCYECLKRYLAWRTPLNKTVNLET